MWRGEVAQLINLGHYFKALVNVDGLPGTLKVYVTKSVALREGDAVTLVPLRYLAYRDDLPPVEMRQHAGEGVVAFR
jgi:hypothetical protein